MSRYVGLLTSRASRRHLTDHPASAGCPAGSSRTGQDPWASGTLIRAGDVVKWFNTEVCKTSIHRFESGRRLHTLSTKRPAERSAGLRLVGSSIQTVAQPSRPERLSIERDPEVRTRPECLRAAHCGRVLRVTP
jgi:hypothetical protein